MKSQKIISALLACTMMLSLAACGSDPAPAENVTPESKTSAADAPSEAPKDDKDPFGKYDPPITLTTVLRTTPTDTYPMDGTNVWGKKYAEYGINLEVLWTADASQYESKLNTVIAAGDIPDFFSNCSPQQMNTLVKGDMVADMTAPLNDYLTPEVNELLLGETAQNSINAVTYDGKIRFLPQGLTENQADVFPVFIRSDWLKALNLEIPKTTEELKETAIAFTKNDPDKNGKADTYGLAIAAQSSLLTDWGGLHGVFASFGVQPTFWYDGMIYYSKDASGKAVWDGTLPETKVALQWLSDLYKEGAIPQDFPTMDSSKVTEELNGGKAGIVYGARGLPFWAIQNTIVNNPNAEWYAMNPPTVDGSHAKIFGWQPVNVAMAVSNTCKNPEAIAKMLNVQFKFAHRSSPDLDSALANQTDININGTAYVSLYEATEREQWNCFFDAVKAKDKSLLFTKGQEGDYDKYMDYEATKNPENWGIWNGGAPKEGGAYYTVWNMNTPADVKNNVYWATPTDDMTTKLQILKKMEEEEVVKIISGKASVDDWDKMVEQWNKIGGDEITQYVNENMK